MLLAQGHPCPCDVAHLALALSPILSAMHSQGYFDPDPLTQA